MVELKTGVSGASVTSFIEAIPHPGRRADAFRLLELFSEATGMEAKMWGSMIGFGSYHYEYKSGHEGDAFLTGFAPRKAAISLYLNLWEPQSEALLGALGKHTRGKSCVYVNKLLDIDTDILKKLIVLSLNSVKKMYPEWKA